jgi:hypothetical protein
MSLINDALKRAKVQQQSSPDAPRMQFRPVEGATPPVKKCHTTIWIAVVIIAGLVIGFVFRQLTRDHKNAAPKEVKAREVVPANPNPQAPAAIASTPTQDIAAVPIIREPEPRIVPKLQAVVFDLKHPSAIIGGRSVFVGDRVNDLRVVAISRESVTLAGGGQTNVLALGE